MIYPKHPVEACNRQQETTLESFPPEQRRKHELQYSYANAAYRYHYEAKAFEPTEADYHEWLEGLPEQVRKGMSEKGFRFCKTVLSFTRYMMEKNDVGLDQFVSNLMGEENYSEYRGYLDI